MTKIFTIGHSTHPIVEFIELLKSNGIEEVADIRTIPKSRFNPQFNKETLSTYLRNRGIGYRHMKSLGGLRHSRNDSPNTGWKNLSFRGYADYMQAEEFKKAIEELAEIARNKTTVIMCAEALPWKCHRSLVGDALTIRGFEVEDIMGPNKLNRHKLTPWARVEGERIVYPGDDEKESLH